MCFHAYLQKQMTQMDTVKIFALMFFAAFVLFLPGTESQLHTHPLCVSQYALVDHACAFLPYTPLSPPSPPSPTPSPPGPPSPPSPDDDDGHHSHGHGNQHGHGHRHRHRHRHRADYQETPEQADCCKWLKELDDECACDLLVRLPPFLSKPAHQYTVVVDEACSVTYSCPGRLRP